MQASGSVQGKVYHGCCATGQAAGPGRDFISALSASEFPLGAPGASWAGSLGQGPWGQAPLGCRTPRGRSGLPHLCPPAPVFQNLPVFLIKCIGETLVNKTMQVSSSRWPRHGSVECPVLGDWRVYGDWSVYVYTDTACIRWTVTPLSERTQPCEENVMPDPAFC